MRAMPRENGPTRFHARQNKYNLQIILDVFTMEPIFIGDQPLSGLQPKISAEATSVDAIIPRGCRAAANTTLLQLAVWT